MFGDAQAYERFMGRWSSLLAPKLVRFAGMGESGEILDVGSGTGALANALVKMYSRCRVTGIDPSQEYVAYAASRSLAPSRTKFEVGDAQNLKFPDASFDHSSSLLVFNFIPDRPQALREMIRVTRAKGTVSAAVWDYGNGMKMLRVFWDAATALHTAAKPKDERHMPLCREGELTALWNQGGLQDVEESPLDIDMAFSSLADYWDPFLLGQGPAGAFVRGLNSAQKEALRKDLKQRLRVPSEPAALKLPARAWAVRGRRA